MPILPFHGNCARERRFRLYVTLVRRLGITFIVLLSVASLVFYGFISIVPHDLALSSTPSIVQSSIYPTDVPVNSRHVIQYDSKYTWETIRPGEHCLRYATREYTSRLFQVSGTHNSTEAIRACREIPVEIHGRLLKSDWCQDLGFGRGIYGFWINDFEEDDCKTRWGEFNDLGCSETHPTDADERHVRRVESRLNNLQPGSSWQIMCATTPAEIYGQRFGSPAACSNDITQGVYGEWHVQDSTCN